MSRLAEWLGFWESSLGRWLIGRGVAHGNVERCLRKCCDPYSCPFCTTGGGG